MKKRDVIFLSLLSFIIIALGVSIFILPTRNFSEKENRNLKKAPSISAEALQSGEYFKQISAFYSDQFPLRDAFTSLYAITELSLGKKQVGDIIYTDNILVARDENGGELMNAVKIIKNLCPEASIYIPPSSAEVFWQSLPKSIKRELSLPAANSLPPECYYKTDHHWTSEGAYLAYTQICAELGITPYSEDFFEKITVATDFRGSAYARSCLPKWMVTPDSITLYRYFGDEDTKIFCHDNQTMRQGFYDFSALEGADKYRVFLGGNYAHLSISGKVEKPRLVLVKDSFANSVIPFLALHFNIEVIDPRYCTKSELMSFLNEDNILFLMSEATLNECFN